MSPVVVACRSSLGSSFRFSSETVLDCGRTLLAELYVTVPLWTLRLRFGLGWFHADGRQMDMTAESTDRQPVQINMMDIIPVPVDPRMADLNPAASQPAFAAERIGSVGRRLLGHARTA